MLDGFHIQPVLTGIDIGRNEAACGEGVDADVAFLQHHDTGPAAGVFLVVALSKIDHRAAQDGHFEGGHQIRKRTGDCFPAVERGVVAVVAVEGEVFAEVGHVGLVLAIWQGVMSKKTL